MWVCLLTQWTFNSTASAEKEIVIAETRQSTVNGVENQERFPVHVIISPADLQTWGCKQRQSINWDLQWQKNNLDWKVKMKSGETVCPFSRMKLLICNECHDPIDSVIYFEVEISSAQAISTRLFFLNDAGKIKQVLNQFSTTEQSILCYSWKVMCEPYVVVFQTLQMSQDRKTEVCQ